MSNLISKTIGEIVTERAKLTPNVEGISYQNYSYSWKDTDEISDFLAIEYLNIGIKKGTHVAIWSTSNPNWVLAYLALAKIGAISILINTCYKEGELKEVLKNTDIEYVFYGKGYKDLDYKKMLENIKLDDFKKIKKLISIEKDTLIKYYLRKDYEDNMCSEDKYKLSCAKNLVKSNDLANILFTSGTTKLPKGVMLSHFSLVNNSLEISKKMKWNETDKLCVAVRLFHCFGITAGILAGINSGASIHLIDFYSTIEVLKQIEKYKCTVLNGVPTMFIALSRNINLKKYDISSIKSGIIAGSSIHPEEYKEICKSLNIEYLQTSYGQTETSPCISISNYDDNIDIKSKSVGKVIDNIEVKILNNNEKREATVCEVGEILTRGYHVMQGYYNLNEETEKIIDSDGWLHTGDIGCFDSNGYMYIKGRLKEMIIRGAENISPKEIEYYIEKLESVKMVKVLGIEAEVLQEEIVACVMLKKGSLLSEIDIKKSVSKYLSYYKVPKYIIFIEEFPMTSSGKIKITELKNIVKRLIKLKEENICTLQSNMN